MSEELNDKASDLNEAELERVSGGTQPNAAYNCVKKVSDFKQLYNCAGNNGCGSFNPKVTIDNHVCSNCSFCVPIHTSVIV